jgi:hypothetical protein
MGKERPVTSFCYSNNIYSISAIINNIFYGVTVKNANILEKLLVTK